MKTYIVLLRGVMPTGKNKIPSMAMLKEVLENAGFQRVRTYIQSGNVVLKSSLSVEEIQENVHWHIEKNIGANLSVIVTTADVVEQVLSQNPFTDGYDIKRVFFTFTNDKLDFSSVEALASQDFAEEKFDYSAEAMYMYIPTDASRSKLSNNFLEKKLKITATTRNFNTLSKLVAIAREVENMG